MFPSGTAPPGPQRPRVLQPQRGGQRVVDAAGATSRFVCIQMADRPLLRIFSSRCPWGVSCRTVCTGSHLQFITGWWLTISWQFSAMASSATASRDVQGHQDPPDLRLRVPQQLAHVVPVHGALLRGQSEQGLFNFPDSWHGATLPHLQKLRDDGPGVIAPFLASGADARLDPAAAAWSWMIFSMM